VACITRRVQHAEHELLTLPEHMTSPPVFSWVHVDRSFVFCVVFCRSLFVPLFFLIGYCIVFPSSIYVPVGIFKLYL
jgi:hypothetical protein